MRTITTRRRVSSLGQRGTILACGAAALAASAGRAKAQAELLPDIITLESFLRDHTITDSGGLRLLKLSNATANIGAGKLHLFGGDTHGTTRDVWQRVYRDDETFFDRLAGQFVFHPQHGHIHFDNWAIYRLREVLPGMEVGEIVREGAKTSFCILDLVPYDPTLPGFPPRGEFNACESSVQGLSVGWMDIYDKSLAGQSIDITGVAAGQYWLESEVDPFDSVLEADESNNATRILVTIPPATGELIPDPFEPNESLAETAARTEGQANSPNFGPTDPFTLIDDLTIWPAGDRDFYRFYLAGPGSAGDFARIDFTNLDGDLDLKLYNDAGAVVASSTSSVLNFESVGLTGRASGWYTIEVYAFGGGTNDYRLTINPPQNEAPSVDVKAPPAGDIVLEHGVDTYPVRWVAADPELGPTWVTILANTTPSLTGAIVIPDTLNTPGDRGFAVINSAHLTPGTWWFYARTTDGGLTIGDWSEGTITFVEGFCYPDCDTSTGAGTLDFFDFICFQDAFAASDPFACECDTSSGPGVCDFFDFVCFQDAFAGGC